MTKLKAEDRTKMQSLFKMKCNTFTMGYVETEAYNKLLNIPEKPNEKRDIANNCTMTTRAHIRNIQTPIKFIMKYLRT